MWYLLTLHIPHILFYIFEFSLSDQLGRVREEKRRGKGHGTRTRPVESRGKWGCQEVKCGHERRGEERSAPL